MLNDSIHIARRSDLNEVFVAQWIGLFQRCFGGTEEKAARVFQKYLLNDSMFCCLFKSGVMIAAYCGIKVSYEDGAAFLSTDTMSDGTKRGGHQLYWARNYMTRWFWRACLLFLAIQTKTLEKYAKEAWGGLSTEIYPCILGFHLSGVFLGRC